MNILGRSANLWAVIAVCSTLSACSKEKSQVELRLEKLEAQITRLESKFDADQTSESKTLEEIAAKVDALDNMSEDRIAAQLNRLEASLRAVSPANEARKQELSRAQEILNDARILSSAADQWAVEEGKPIGTPLRWEVLRPYIREGTRIREAEGLDLHGRPYIYHLIGDFPPIEVNPATVMTFDPEVVPPSFWRLLR